MSTILDPVLSVSAAAPSRLDNPFATCWTRPGALPFQFSDEQSADDLVAKLAAQQWCGAIIGPHGSGKSTLVETLKPALIAAGRNMYSISLRDGQRRLPHGWCATALQSGGKCCLLIIDGYEQLAWLEKLRLTFSCHRGTAGLLVTSHSPVCIPTLVRLSPDRQLIERLVAGLCARMSTPITSADITASHACHGSNVREIFFDLYDRHEKRRRRSSTLAATS